MALNSNALTSVANLKFQLNILTSDNTQNTMLELYINAASQAIETYCDRKFKIPSSSYVEYHDGGGMDYILPRQYPVTEITDIRIDQERVFGTDTIVDATEYEAADEGQTITSDRIFPTGRQNVRLTYKAGYDPVPADIELACLWTAEWFYRQRARGDMGRTSVSKGDESVGVLAELPKQVLQLIEQYKRTEAPATNSPVRNR